MYVDNINVLSAHFDENRSQHKAIIHMVIEEKNVTVSCSSKLPKNARISDIIGDLIQDAKRQMLRMPEYRNGSKKLIFASSTKQKPNAA